MSARRKHQVVRQHIADILEMKQCYGQQQYRAIREAGWRLEAHDSQLAPTSGSDIWTDANDELLIPDPTDELFQWLMLWTEERAATDRFGATLADVVTADGYLRLDVFKELIS